MTTGEILANQIDGTRDWTLKLMADLDGDDWHFQPAPGMAHPLWLCGHLAFAQDLLVHQRVFGGPAVIDAAFAAHFPIGEPVRSAAEYDYPGPELIRKIMDETHRRTLERVREISDVVLAEKAFGKDGAIHPHYTDKLGALTHCMRHEAFHAGQLASIRRLLGKSFLR